MPSNRHPRIWTFKPKVLSRPENIQRSQTIKKSMSASFSIQKEREQATRNTWWAFRFFLKLASHSSHRCCSRFYQDQETNVWPEKSNLLAVRKKNTIAWLSFFLSLSKRAKESQVILFLFQTTSNFALSGHTFVSWSWYYPRPSLFILCFNSTREGRGSYPHQDTNVIINFLSLDGRKTLSRSIKDLFHHNF